MKNNKIRLYTIIGTIVILVVTSIMSIFLIYNYYDEKKTLTNQIYTKSEITLNRLKKSIAPFISSYAVNEYEKLITNEMADKEIYAIVVEDYVTGTLIDAKSFLTSKIQSPNGKVIDNKNLKFNGDNYFFETESIITNIDNSVELGQIKIYFTDKYLNIALNKLIVKNIIVTTLIALSLIIFLYIALKIFIIKPLSNLSTYLSNKDKDGLPKQFHTIQGSKEITDLSVEMDQMINKIKTSKEELDKLNERFNLTLEAVNDGIWDWNIKTGQTYFSKRWKAMLGYRDDELENNLDTFTNLIHENDKNKVQENLDKHFKNPSKYPYSIEVRLRCKDGSYKWILSRGKVYLDKEKNPERMLGYHTDITKEKENKEYQKQQEKIITEQAKLASMGEMIGNIAHQWRQPLSVISTGATGMKLQKEFNTLSDEHFMKTCDTINDNAQYLSKTIDDFRNFIKGDRKAVEFKLSDDIESFLHLIEGSIKSNNIEIIENLKENIIINGYPNELAQCFINIFNNSKDAFINQEIDKRLLFISTDLKDDKAIITFKDNAGGIPDDILPKVFEPYFTTKHQSQGTGLGLHMTYNLIVDGMNGTIEVKNETYIYNDNEYTGASFIIKLPSI